MVYWAKSSVGKVGWSQFVKGPAHWVRILDFILKKTENVGGAMFNFASSEQHSMGEMESEMEAYGERRATGGREPG